MALRELAFTARRTGIPRPMAQPSEERPSPQRAACGEADAVMAADRLRAEIHSAVRALRDGLPRVFRAGTTAR